MLNSTCGLRVASMRSDIAHVVRRDVTLVRARMHGDPVHAGRQAHRDGVGHARQTAAAGVSDRRDLVDVDGERS